MAEKILLEHGSGGRLSHDLIRDHFFNHFNNSILKQNGDSALLNNLKNPAFTTDSYVVDPIFFPGGNIGKLAVCGTVNDLIVAGALPLYLSAGFIIEEGFPFADLDVIIKTMAEEAKKAGVWIVTGDTKVVSKGQCDKIFINTAGIGTLRHGKHNISTGTHISPGDSILINGFIGDHGIAVMGKRESLQFGSDVRSDCASLHGISKNLLDKVDVHFMRDATRGGLATVLTGISEQYGLGIEVEEDKIPVRDSIRGLCELFGFDPLYVANEGKIVVVVPGEQEQLALEIIQNSEHGKAGSVIGRITDNHPGKVIMHTGIGGKRFIDMLAGEQLPRIC